MPKKDCKWEVDEIVEIYFPETMWRKRPLLPDLLLVCLEFSGMVGSSFFWVYF